MQEISSIHCFSPILHKSIQSQSGITFNQNLLSIHLASWAQDPFQCKCFNLFWFTWNNKLHLY